MIMKNYLRCIPADARLFCGVDQLEELQQVYGQKGILWPLPIDTRRFEPAVRNPRWGKLVSVGRLSPQKEYNLYMINVVKELRKKGYPVTWSVYGVGEFEPEMRERIRQEGLQDAISMEGTAPYRNFWQVLSDAYVFIGMGTAILEAALFRVPNLYAIPYDRVGITAGPVYRIPPGSNAPPLSCPPPLRVIDELERILRLSRAEYEKEEEMSYRHVRHHELEASMAHFLRLVQSAGPIRRSKWLYLANYPRRIFHSVIKCCIPDKKVPHPTATPYFSKRSARAAAT